nr:MAG TPA: hypothetical protein [Caudoviricetes sp.]
METYSRIVTKTWHTATQRTSKVLVKLFGFVGTRNREICWFLRTE